MVVTLQRLEENEGSAISFTSLRAPTAAVKEYHKGHLLLYRKDVRGALKAFERAVTLYPEYASAWDDLGVLQERLGQLETAVRAYEKAAGLDGRFLQPLYHLARLAAEQGQWESALGWSERAMGLNAVEFPGIYLAHGIAAMNLGRPLAVSERSLRRAAQLDLDNLLPRAHYLLGLVLQQKGDRAGAAECFRNYLMRTRDPAEQAKARQKLEALGAVQ
jgi:tetratricopeptide (TPR) repeat protein